MNKQTNLKVKFFLEALIARLFDNEEFFEKIRYTYYSGTKAFVGNVEFKDGKFENRFNTKTEMVGKKEISDALLRENGAYNRLVIEYFERGTCFLIDATDKKVLQKTIENDKKENKSEKGHDLIKTGIDFSKRDYILKIGEADALLKEIGILTSDGKIKNDMIRKYNQIDHFIELAKNVIDAFDKDKKIYVLDCACGKSYLSFVLNYYMRDILKLNCSFIGVDIKPNVIETSKKMAKNLGYNNMEFVCEDMNTYTPNVKIDLLISLHACDTATDMSLGLGIRNKVKSIICVPCCHREMLSQYSCEPIKALLEFPVFKARLADNLTDAMRSLYLKAKGYDVTAVEYISPLETPKNLMIKAVRKREEDKCATNEYNSIKKLLNTELSIEKYANM